MNTNITLASLTYKFRLFEIQIILLFAYMSFLFIFNTDYIIFFLAIELFSFSTILLTLFKNNLTTTNITIIYFFINAISSIFILLGLFFSFYFFGFSFIFFNSNFLLNVISYDTSYFFIILGLLIKLGSAPFHFWVLPLYDSIPTIITLYQSVIPKIIYIFLFYHFNFIFNNLITISIILSFLFGSFIGIYQSKIKKLLAASSIVNLGFFFLTFLPLANATQVNSFIINPFLYFFLYFINIINIFSILLFFHNLSKLKDLSPIPFIFPFLSFLLMISIFSFIGIPPFAGFFAKIFVLANLIFNLNPFYFFFILFSLFATVISAYFYLYFIIYTYNNNIYPFYNISQVISLRNPINSSIIYIISISSLIILIWPLLNIYFINWFELFLI